MPIVFLGKENCDKEYLPRNVCFFFLIYFTKQMKELNELHSETLKEEKNKRENVLKHCLTSSFITFVSRMFSNNVSQRLSCFVINTC